MRYRNPVLYIDLSYPDVIRVGEDFYMTASSFTCVPGLPVLHSRDLVHWEIIGHAADRLPHPRYDHPAHGCGIWAPSIRWHRGLFYIYACMPDEGLYAWTSENPAGPWQCRLVKAVTGWIDPCPLFTEDGVWLVHGFAASRIGGFTTEQSTETSRWKDLSSIAGTAHTGFSALPAVSATVISLPCGPAASSVPMSAKWCWSRDPLRSTVLIRVRGSTTGTEKTGSFISRMWGLMAGSRICSRWTGPENGLSWATVGRPFPKETQGSRTVPFPSRALIPLSRRSAPSGSGRPIRILPGIPCCVPAYGSMPFRRTASPRPDIFSPD